MATSNDHTKKEDVNLSGRLDGKTHILPVRVYYEDTDFAGVVYHANYLRYCERGRTDFLRLLGVDQTALFAGSAGEQLSFAVRAMNIEFHKPARMDDVLEVETRLDTITGARINMHQSVARAGTCLFSAQVEIVMINGEGLPRRIPKSVYSALFSND